MIEIHVQPIEELIRKPLRSSKNLTGYVWWTNEHDTYPYKGWIDSCGEVVFWWTNTILKLVNYSPNETFFFMEGSYSIDAIAQGNGGLILEFEGRDMIWETTVDDVVRQVLLAEESLQESFIAYGLPTEQLQSHASMIRKLRCVTTR